VPRVIPAYTLLPMPPRSAIPSFTSKQGQYLAFIYAYTRVLGRPPAEADLQRHFGVSPPSVHQMVLTLERAGLIRRQPGVAGSIEVLVASELLPVLRQLQQDRSSAA
jgi:DNA-binding MarR family transcriptional regulator